MDLHTALLLLLDGGRVRMRGHRREELQGVDRNLCLSGVELKGRRHEALREEEGGDPEAEGGALRQPRRHEGDALDEVDHPRVQRLQAWVRHLAPVAGHLLDQEGVVHALEVGGHQHDALDGLVKHLQTRLHRSDHLHEAGVLLAVEDTDGYNSTLGCLPVGAGVGLLRFHRIGDVPEEVVCHVGDDLLGALARAAGGDARLHAGDSVKELPRLAILRRDEGVGVEAEYAGVLIHG
mmetsp:Transcript_70384/g.219794  ORF Transcript_70384/g.219794 Transcript_70384/m.219794 type:complete len:236 (-) Transcript_70384:106-813(-)|eukprot:CAMPEP_0175418180 /NCGR_PEP_ID=MMETSP0095-20121207/45583_1 /TAXON_ID=311494 /ORGANISM="Alexandrium monilatum, Strain CCMP3105" /LENGTH=235 /DNA_ID=CAMNT_0016717337 /DNA_START=292 /DNA_END=999 /DNA_ORIENTATION=-